MHRRPPTNAWPELRQPASGSVETGPVGYVVKMYPRFSETFIVNEILAHEAAGVDIAIFSLRAPLDGRFHDTLARVRGSVRYLSTSHITSGEFWDLLRRAAVDFPNLWSELAMAEGAESRDIIQAIELARVARDGAIVHLHAHFATVAATVARLASRLTGIPYTITAHAKDIYHEEVDDRRLQRLIADASSVVTVSHYNLKYLQDRFGDVAAQRVKAIYNGLDLSRFPYQAPDQAPAQKERRVVAVGRLIEKKGFGDLIDACALLKGRGRPVECRIAGSGPLENELRAKVKAHALEPSVEFCGAVPQHDVIQLVRDAAVLVAPCVVGADGNRDGLPTVLLEAMALGTPVIATPVTGIPELVEDRTTGLIVPERDPDALADAIDRLIEDRRLAARLSASARLLIEAQFDIEKTTARQRLFFTGALTSERSL